MKIDCGKKKAKKKELPNQCLCLPCLIPFDAGAVPAVLLLNQLPGHAAGKEAKMAPDLGSH